MRRRDQRTYLEQFVDLFEAASLEFREEEDKEEERQDGEDHKDKAEPGSQSDNGSSLEVGNVEYGKESKEDIGNGGPCQHLFAHLRTANLGGDEVALRSDTEFAHSVQEDNGRNDNVGLGRVGTGVRLGADGSDQT